MFGIAVQWEGFRGFCFKHSNVITFFLHRTPDVAPLLIATFVKKKLLKKENKNYIPEHGKYSNSYSRHTATAYGQILSFEKQIVQERCASLQ